ncbi:MAG: DUF7010 family protein [Gemmatimonadota bacterium]
MDEPNGTIAEAQSDLRHAYLRGGPGTLVSGVVWLVAGIAAGSWGVRGGFLLLYFGGVLIFPLSQLIIRGLLRQPAVRPGNLGARIVGETVAPMIGGLLGAWLLIPHRPELVFPLAAIAVGAHYFGFRSAYGDRTFWILGAILCGIGIVPIFGLPMSAPAVAFAVSGAEIVIGSWLAMRSQTHPEH